MNMRIEVVAAAIIDNGLVLACRRSPDKAAAGRWEFPGGKVEDGEDPKSALRRELREELSTDVTVGALLNRAQTTADGITIDLATYYATLASDRPRRSTDHDRMAWLPVDQLADLEWATPDLPALKALVQGGSAPRGL